MYHGATSTFTQASRLLKGLAAEISCALEDDPSRQAVVKNRHRTVDRVSMCWDRHCGCPINTLVRPALTSFSQLDGFCTARSLPLRPQNGFELTPLGWRCLAVHTRVNEHTPQPPTWTICSLLIQRPHVPSGMLYGPQTSAFGKGVSYFIWGEQEGDGIQIGTQGMWASIHRAACSPSA